MYYKETVKADNDGISAITRLINDRLGSLGIKSKELTDTVLAAEEAAGSLIEHIEGTDSVTVRIISCLGYISVELSSRGNRYDPKEITADTPLLDTEAGEAAQDMIRGILLRSMAESLKYRHINGTNRINITVHKNKRAFLYETLGSMGLAIIAGLILTSLGHAGFNSALDTYFLFPVKTMYMNALKMVVAPVVFFSIVSCIVRFSDISELGRVGGRVLSLYLLTTFIAVGVGIGSYSLFKPGSPLPSEAAVQASADITSKTMNVSIKDTIVGIVPSDFIQPFVESNMLQLIFLAVICGICAGLIGRYSGPVKDLFEAFNELFLKITTVVIRFMPIAVFCSICSMMLDMGLKTIVSILGIFLTFVFGLICMMLVYSVIIALTGRISPLPFLKKYPQTMLQVFSMASSNASIPLNMSACENLGIPQKIYSLSIPLGATVNMDGACVYMAVFSLALAKTYGVQLTGASMTAMIISIIVLSIGAPGIPGSGLICLSVLLTQLGVPTEAVGLVMGVDSLVGMFRCMSNCTGDVAMSIVVASKEKTLDMNKYV